MERLFDESKEVMEVYRYRINNYGIGSEPELCRYSGSYPSQRSDVEIVFKNGKFSEASYPFSGKYTLAQWEVLGAIAKRIKEISESRQGEV